MLQYTESEASRLGMQIDMNTGTGWPFGGPEVGIEDAACKLFVTEYRLEGGNTLDQRIEVADKNKALCQTGASDGLFRYGEVSGFDG